MSRETVLIPRNLSFSQADSLRKCGYQWYLERGLGYSGRHSWALPGGTAVHSATEEWDRMCLTEDGCVTPDPDVAREMFERHFEATIAGDEETYGPSSEWRATGRPSKDWPDKRDRKWWDHHGPIYTYSWMAWMQNSPWGVAVLPDEHGEAVDGIELDVKTSIDGIEIRMFVDRLLSRVTPEGETEYLIVDIKTGATEPSDALQLLTYRRGLETTYGISPKWGGFWMAPKGGVPHIHDLTRWPSAALDWMYTSAREIQLAGATVPKTGPMCSACSVRDYCFAVGGEKANTIPGPWEVEMVERPLDFSD